MAKIAPIAAGLLLDVFDWLLVGAVPVLGDVVDLIGIAYFWKHLGPMALVGLLELVPLLDGLPTFTALGVLTYLREDR